MGMKLSLFDAFAKAKGDYVLSRTSSGAIITLTSVVVALALALSEFSYYQQIVTENHVKIDTRPGERNLTIALDISFFHLACQEIGVAFQDSKGNRYPHEVNHMRYTDWIHQEGGADNVIGCQVAGTVDVRQVAGAMYFSLKKLLEPAANGITILNLNALNTFNASHRINSLSFGPAFPGQSSQLAGSTAVVSLASAQWQYHIKIVPTMYIPLGTDSAQGIESEEYSATQFLHSLGDGSTQNLMQPGVFFKYDFSPIMVWKQQTKKSFMQFITSLCAIVGGVFSVSGIVNAMLHKSVDAIRKLD